MKRILIPTDFSENAKNAAHYAVSLFKEEQCTFYFLHTYTPAFYRLDYAMGGQWQGGTQEKELDKPILDLEETIKNVKEKFSNPLHEFQARPSYNFLTDEILEMVQHEKIDMIIMGTQGATGAKEVFLGTNAVQVMRKSPIPVLMVPSGYDYKPIQRILYPTDYMTHFRISELYAMIDLAKQRKAEIVVFHVVEEDDLTEDQIRNKAFLDKCLEGVTHSFVEDRTNYMPLALIEFLEKEPFDMLCMMNRKHSFLERILLKQNIDFMGFHSNVPLMAIRDTAPITA